MMNVRLARTALLAAGLLLLTQGANLSQPNPLPDSHPDLTSMANGTDDPNYGLAAARAAAQSSSVWQLLAAQR
jgi:hypothetical protein